MIAYSLNVSETLVNGPKNSYTFGSTNSSTDRFLYSAVDMCERVTDSLHCDLMCNDDVDMVEAMRMSVVAQIKLGFARNEECLKNVETGVCLLTGLYDTSSVAFHDAFMCSDGVYIDKAMQMSIAVPIVNCFIGKEEILATFDDVEGCLGNNCVTSCVRDLFVTGQGRDLLPESLGPGGKLG